MRGICAVRILRINRAKNRHLVSGIIAQVRHGRLQSL